VSDEGAKLLLDTHAFIWWLVEPSRLSKPVLDAIKDRRHAVYVSAATAMEIATKHRLGKLPIVDDFVADLEATLRLCGFEALPIEFEDAVAAGHLTIDNRDPFDRLLIAQALRGEMTLFSNEIGFNTTGVARLWA
jgi:PIN domain nuclease of toxin-antitoxin system